MADAWEIPVFIVNERGVTVGEVIKAAWHRGELAEAWAKVCESAAAEYGEEEDEETGEQVDTDEEGIQAASEQFRIARDLITAEETGQWLEQRGLTLDDFSDYFRRGTAPSAGAAAMVNFEGGPEGWRERLRVDLLMSGQFDVLAEALAWRCAGCPSGAAGLDWSAMEEAFAQKRAALLTEGARAETLAMLRPSLTRYEVEIMEVESGDVAREAWLCLTEDGLSIDEVAREGRYPVKRGKVRREEVPVEWQNRLANANPGAVLEPIPHGDGFHLCLLLRKWEPILGEPEVDARVERHLLERHFAMLSTPTIRWLLAPGTISMGIPPPF
jgi:hypothetical protein